jgi:arginase
MSKIEKSAKVKHILPVPFALSPYGNTATSTYKKIIGVEGANENLSQCFPSNLIKNYCEVHDPIKFDILGNDLPEIGHYLRSLASLQGNLAEKIEEILPKLDSLAIIGGDHSISVGTGLGLSRFFDLSDVGLIWIDAHADSNTPQTSISKCLTGYPVAINAGLGPEVLTKPFQGNFIQNIVQIGLRDVDELEIHNLRQLKTKVFSILDVVELGLKRIVDQALESLGHCKYLWLSIDIDSLDSVYFQPDETDVPCPGGLTPRELLYIVNRIHASGKLLVTELTQVNDLGKITPVIVLCSRILEMALGLGQFRYAQASPKVLHPYQLPTLHLNTAS